MNGLTLKRYQKNSSQIKNSEQTTETICLVTIFYNEFPNSMIRFEALR